MLLTVAELREHVETSLGDDAVQRLLDGLEAEIVRYAGPPGEQTDRIRGGQQLITLLRPTSRIVSVSESWYTTTTTLDPDDYELLPNGQQLLRKRTGPNPRYHWWWDVTVVSIASDDDDIRIGVLLDLFRLAEDFDPGVTSEQIGAWMEQRSANSQWNQSTARESILGRLDDGPWMAIV